jgi:N4-gp56 family major capsid protein
MSGATQVPAGSPIARKVYGAMLGAMTQRRKTMGSRLVGPAPKQADAEAILRRQTSPDMPFVRVTDLSRQRGDTVTMDLIHPMTGKPIMGSRNREGKGESLNFSTFEAKINKTSKVADVGDDMMQQRTIHQLRPLAMANLAGYFGRLEDQRQLVAISGARGSVNTSDWCVPLASDADFAEIMVNPVKAPSYNRHYVVDGSTLVQGGAQLASIDSTDILRLEHLDAIATIIDDMAFKPAPVRIADDPAADDEPMYLMIVSNKAWNSIVTNVGANSLQWRTFLQNAWQRKSYGSKHPLFTGETGMWRRILVKTADWAVRFLPSDAVPHITSANRYTATETNVTVNGSLGAGYAVDRCVLLGAQALAILEGRNSPTADVPYSWKERVYNGGDSVEIIGDAINGIAKVRHTIPDGAGNYEPTDTGAFVIDVAVSV